MSMKSVDSVTATLRPTSKRFSGTRANVSTAASSSVAENTRSKRSSDVNPVKSLRRSSRINNSESSSAAPKVNGSRAVSLRSTSTRKTNRITSKQSQQRPGEKYSDEKNRSVLTAKKRKVSVNTETLQHSAKKRKVSVNTETLQRSAKKRKVSATSRSVKTKTAEQTAKRQTVSATSTSGNPKTLQRPAKKKISATSTLEKPKTLQPPAKKQKVSATSTSENPETSLNYTITTHEETHKQKRTKENICCTVCLDTIDMLQKEDRVLVSTKCGHIFCNSCIEKSISKGRGCPACRGNLTKSCFHPVYL